MQRIDLHLHSTESDGSMTPTELAFYAKAKGLDAIALTDHDTISGLKACIAAGEKVGLPVIAGIEFAAQFETTEIHLLGYGFDIENRALNERLAAFHINRAKRNEQMLTQLQNIGLTITWEDVLATCKSENTVITRAHFANALVAKGYVATTKDAFNQYLSSDRPGYVKRSKVSPSECIDLIHGAGGIAVLAHPFFYGLTESDTYHLITSLIPFGLDGVEVIYPEHTEENLINLFDLCLKHKLVPTGGSDFHGTNKPHLEIGVGYGNMKVPKEILEAITIKQHLV